MTPRKSLDTLRLSPAFWQRIDVGEALERRDFAGLLKLVHKYGRGSQTQIAVAVDMDRGRSATLSAASGSSKDSTSSSA